MFAEITYFEPWWMQILKSLVIFFVVFNLVPVTLRDATPEGTVFMATTALDGPLVEVRKA